MLTSTHPLGTISVHLHPPDPLLEHAAEVRLVIILIPGRRAHVRGCDELRIVPAVQERTRRVAMVVMLEVNVAEQVPGVGGDVVEESVGLASR